MFLRKRTYNLLKEKVHFFTFYYYLLLIKIVTCDVWEWHGNHGIYNHGKLENNQNSFLLLPCLLTYQLPLPLSPFFLFMLPLSSSPSCFLSLSLPLLLASSLSPPLSLSHSFFLSSFFFFLFLILFLEFYTLKTYNIWSFLVNKVIISHDFLLLFTCNNLYCLILVTALLSKQLFHFSPEWTEETWHGCITWCFLSWEDTVKEMTDRRQAH